jgi:hypothetical protein
MKKLIAKMAEKISAPNASPSQKPRNSFPVRHLDENGAITLGVPLTTIRPMPSPPPFALIPGRFSLMTPGGVDQITCDIEAAAELSGFDPGAFFLDTLARGFDGADENSPSDMGRFISSVDKIRERTGAAAIILHHQTKHATMDDGGRGHGALRGAYDTALHVGEGKVSIFEQRALRPGKPIRFQIVEVGPDSEGKMIETAVAEINPTAFTEPAQLTPVLQAAFDLFLGMASENAEGVVVGAEWNARMKAAREALCKKAPSAPTLSGWRKDLIELDLIEAVGDDRWRLV